MPLLDLSMDDLPVEFMVDILSRLPVKTIIHCKCVCKKWRKIVSDSYFADLHLLRSPAGFMICHNTTLEYHNYEEYELDGYLLHLNHVLSLDLNLVPIFQNSKILPVGSVNGLVCPWQFGEGNDNTCIFNPITREYVILPRQQYYKEGSAIIVYCFGFGSVTCDYKVIRIFQRYILPNLSTSEAEVYTLGTGQWRSLGHVPYKFDGCSYGAFLNGYAHWIVYDKDSRENIVAFDFDMETFELFPSPPSEATDQSLIFTSLGVLNGCLCLCASDYDSLTVWVMKEYGIKKSWHKELGIKASISFNLGFLILEPVYIIEGSKDGTILMASSCSKKLFLYCGQRITLFNTQISDPPFKGHAYRPSFYRLHNFENERVVMF